MRFLHEFRESYADCCRLPTAASMTVNQSQLFCEAFDYYLGDGKEHLPELHRLSKINGKEADDKIMR